MNEQPLMMPDEVAAYLQLSRQTVIKLAKAGELIGRKAGKQWRFRRSDVEKFLERNEDREPAGVAA